MSASGGPGADHTQPLVKVLTQDRALVFQASGIEDPTSLDEQQQSAAAAAYKLPWLGPICGHVLVPPQGSILGHEAPAALLVLLEGGQLFLHDLAAVTGISADGSIAQIAEGSTINDKVDNSNSEGSPSRGQKQHSSPPKQHEQRRSPTRAKQQPQARELAPPQRLLRGRWQGQPQVTAARLRMIPIDRVPLSGLQVTSDCWVGCVSRNCHSHRCCQDLDRYQPHIDQQTNSIRVCLPVYIGYS